MNLNHLKADYTVMYAALGNPNLEVAIVIVNGKEIAREPVCKKCHQPVIKTSGVLLPYHCEYFCLKHGCLCYSD